VLGVLNRRVYNKKILAIKQITLTASVVIFSIAILSAFTALATKWTVTVQNFSFNPSSLPNVAVGDTIKWVWVSGSHTTTSSTIPGGAVSWDQPINSAKAAALMFS
jgi:plastocyanin